MSNLGATAALADSWLNSLLNIPFTAPVLALQLHKGFPGGGPSDAGTLNLSAVTTRVAPTYSASSGGSGLALVSPPQWNMTAAETISHISAWTGLTGAVCVGIGALLVPKTVANGDLFSLSTCPILFASLASD